MVTFRECFTGKIMSDCLNFLNCLQHAGKSILKSRIPALICSSQNYDASTEKLSYSS